MIPRILEIHDSVVFRRGAHTGSLGAVVEGSIQSRGRREGEEYKVVLLSAPDDPQTERLPAPILNDMTSQSGRPTAFTQNQRYVSLQRLKAARTTSDLLASEP